jgi:hypothetical protein
MTRPTKLSFVLARAQRRSSETVSWEILIGTDSGFRDFRTGSLGLLMSARDPGPGTRGHQRKDRGFNHNQAKSR